MRALRFVGNTVVWLVAALGLASVLVWGATQVGWIKPMVVISGSMEPEIMTGDLVVGVERPTAELQVGEVASIWSDVTGNHVTHRVVGIEQVADDEWHVRMQGDANDSPDGGVYVVGDQVWQPAVTIDRGGIYLSAITRPSVAIPLGVALLALLGLSLLPRTAPRSAPATASVPERLERATTGGSGTGTVRVAVDAGTRP